jgi:hypothetical protein
LSCGLKRSQIEWWAIPGVVQPHEIFRLVGNGGAGTEMDMSNPHAAQEPENESAIVSPGRRPRWSVVVPSLVFSAATFEMLFLYGIVHWDIMFRWRLETPEPPKAVFTVMSHLIFLRLAFAALALIWAVRSFCGAPRWAAWIALGFAILALFTNIIVM